MPYGSGLLAVACLAVGLLHLVRLAVVRGDHVGEASHAAMALGMAAMASPLGNPLPDPVWTAVFVLIAAWFGALALRSGKLGGERGHHVVGSAAMLFMLLVEHGGGSAGGHMAGMAGASHGPPGALVLAPAAAIAFAGYFAWHTLRCADRCRRPAGPAPAVAAGSPIAAGSAVAAGGAVAGDSAVAADIAAPAVARSVRSAWSLHTPRTAAAGHLVLAVSMAAMLMGML